MPFAQVYLLRTLHALYLIFNNQDSPKSETFRDASTCMMYVSSLMRKIMFLAQVVFEIKKKSMRKSTQRCTASTLIT